MNDDKMMRGFFSAMLDPKADDLEQKADNLSQMVGGISRLVNERDYATALFALDNFPLKDVKTDALYGYLAVSMSEDLAGKGKEKIDPGAQQLVNDYIRHCKDNCGYFGKKD